MTAVGKSKLGTYLREARESRGISLSQASNGTRIIQRYLVALENGDFNHLPGDVYARGFIRNYAQYLQLPADELIELYRAERGASTPIQVIPAAVPPRNRTIFVPSIWAVMLVVMAIVVLGYVVFNALGLTNPNSTSIAIGATSTSPIIATPQPLPTATTAPTNPDGSTVNPQPEPTAAPSPTQAAPIQVQVKVLDSISWVQVYVDGQLRLEGIQQVGWTEVFLAQQVVQIKAGNAGAVEVTFNNQPPARMGVFDQVVTNVYPPR